MHIPIDSEIRNDPRFRKVVKALASEAEALLLCFNAWALARRHWQESRSLVPLDLWDAGDFAPLEAAGLAERRDGGVYCRGTKDSFDWYHDWKAGKSTAGKVSAAVRKAKYGTAQPPKKPRTDAEQTPNSVEHARTDSNLQVTVTDTNTDLPSGDKKRAKALSPRKPLEPRYEPCDLNLAKRWLDHAHTITPHLSVSLPKWADAIRLLREQDGLTLDEVTKVFEWVKQDDFWSKNAISPQAIRGRSKNGLKKIENIRVRMKEAPGSIFDDWDEWAKKADAEKAEREARR